MLGLEGDPEGAWRCVEHEMSFCRLCMIEHMVGRHGKSRDQAEATCSPVW